MERHPWIVLGIFCETANVTVEGLSIYTLYLTAHRFESQLGEVCYGSPQLL
jgi:hypothetical protein